MVWIIDRYLELEAPLLHALARMPYVQNFIHDPISARITLFLMIMGSIAIINELNMTRKMAQVTHETSEELNKGYIDESLKLHRLIVSDEYHSKEYLDEKSGIVIEEFEDKEKFFAKPVHVAHLYVECQCIRTIESQPLLEKPLLFHLEFSPEEYENEKRPEFGTRLRVLRKRLYHLFKDSHLFEELVTDRQKFAIGNNVRIFNSQNELLPVSTDDVQLCFLKIETGDKIKCEFVLGE
ncbi:hypothetical protein ZYGR_0A03790 [Zygosaccharomyces rouxii]|uniref:ZYRO0A08580p n=2 Tax=Zygosaccharomyces rouxii TaxID=4956 RepID=C5DQ47_ZYGRC|nr:uncharacterized protein ZYRO0A08580g [Zygosaccharomyces rouxii]KAH9198672.1 hypothetical protein LQ764DRAFT_139896 [Zygosaccharomyces rouxii]GAV46783.1 hypothetical protein ZYGR_0A03790 [Zygosaccharomyces rouxii]CAR25808.1 ZYRO0A08580p [Zygosaccharomyces rouxii]